MDQNQNADDNAAKQGDDLVSLFVEAKEEKELLVRTCLAQEVRVMNWKQATPLLSRGGVAARSRKSRAASIFRADGRAARAR